MLCSVIYRLRSFTRGVWLLADSLSLWLMTAWSWAVTALDSTKACESLIWLMCSVRPFKTLPLLRVRPSDSRPPGSRTCLSGPPSLCDRAASFRFLSSSMLLLLTEGLRCFSISKGGANHCLTTHQGNERQTGVRLAWVRGKWRQVAVDGIKIEPIGSRIYEKSTGTKMNDLDLCLKVVSRSNQPLRYFDVEYLGNR